MSHYPGAKQGGRDYTTPHEAIEELVRRVYGPDLARSIPSTVSLFRLNLADAADFALGRTGYQKNETSANRFFDSAERYLKESASDPVFLEHIKQDAPLIRKVAKALNRTVEIPKVAKPKPAKKAATEVAAGIKEAAEGLFQLFGGADSAKLNAGFTFDPETYARAKPHFEKAVAHLKDAKASIMQMARELVDYMKSVMKVPVAVVERMKPYLARFIEEIRNPRIADNQDLENAPEAQRGAAPEVNDLDETAQQVTYRPRSKIFGLGTLVPTNMRSPTEQALQQLERRVGPLEQYVGAKLGYKTDESGPYFIRAGQKERPFAAEQIDALSLAIDNMERGAALIIGDQTGIGKGRVNAGIIRYAMERKAVPIFVTKDPGLYKDIYRDLTDIGIQEYLGRAPNFLITDAKKTLPLDDDETVVLKTPDVDKHNATLRELTKRGDIGPYDVVLTSYSQMQTVKGQDTDRMAFLDTMAPKAILALDESHNAGGSPKTGDEFERKLRAWEKKRDKAIRTGKPFDIPPPKDVPDRAQFSRQIIDKALAAFYSSATYAKRPDVMDLYRKTDMRLAVKNITELAEAIAKGGVPMQQVVASMLAKAGQYIRRERSFAGVTYEPRVVDVNEDLYDNFSSALAQIQAFSKIVRAVTKTIDDGLKGTGSQVGHDNATGQAGADSMNFTSIMHNLINQMLVSINAKPAAEAAIAALQRGEKPLIAVANTNESFLVGYAKDLGLKPGDAVDLDMSAMLAKYLERSRWISVREPFMEEGEEAEKVRLTDEQLGEEGVALFDEIKSFLEESDFSGLPASPVDFIKGELQKAGYNVGEITGRTLTVDYSGKRAVLASRGSAEKSTRGKNQTIAKYNGGQIDALIINQSGSTGFSMHASSKFKDQSKRVMILAQAESNIDIHMQMLGRVHRTGQVQVPAYIQLIPNVPAAKRPAAVLLKKMASLNANTTANRSSALTADGAVTDFMNEYGDAVAALVMADDPELNERMDWPVPPDATNHDGAMRKLTGRIPLLTVQEQKDLYEKIEGEYTRYLEQLEAEGKNTLEAKSLELDAIKVRSTEAMAPEGTSPFTDGVTLTEYDIKRQGNPYTVETLMDDVAKGLGVDRGALAADPARALEQAAEKGQAQMEEMATEALVRFEPFKTKFLARITDADKHSAQKTRLDGQAHQFGELVSVVYPGNRVRLQFADDEAISGIVLRVMPPKEGAPNPLALGQWRVKVAVPNGARAYELPFTRLVQHRDPEGSQVAVEATGWAEPPQATVQLFDMASRSDVRDRRVIATGNLLKAYTTVARSGQIINFRTHEGEILPGIMLRDRVRTLAEAVSLSAAPMSPSEAVEQLLKHAGTIFQLRSTDNHLFLYSERRGVTIIEANRSRSKGGQYFLNAGVLQAAGKDFYSSGSKMRVDVGDQRLPGVIDALVKAGAAFTRPAELGNVVEHDQPTITQNQVRIAKGLYSQTLKAAQGAKIAKGSGAQWLSTLLNTPGVKPDEIAWIGLDDWLSRQKGPVAKADVVTFISENQVQVHEVEKGEIPAAEIHAKAQELYDAELNKKVDDHLERNDGVAGDHYWAEAVPEADDGDGWDGTGFDGDDDLYELSGAERPSTGRWKYVLHTDDGEEEHWRTFDSEAEAQKAGDQAAEKLNHSQEDSLRTDIANEQMPPWDVFETEARELLAGDDRARQYGEYTLDGGTNYREVLLTLPSAAGPTATYRVEPPGYRDELGYHSGDDEWTIVNQNGEVANSAGSQAEAEAMAARFTADAVHTGRTLRNPTNYHSSHWREPNVLAHVRLAEHTINGQRTLLVEEVQSDWHQAGRKQGYYDAAKPWEVFDPRDGQARAAFATEAEATAHIDAEVANGNVHVDYNRADSAGKVPDAPFKTTWHELALKRILRIAVDEGFDQIAWTSGDTQNERYSLENHIQGLMLRTHADGSTLLFAEREGQRRIYYDVTPDTGTHRMEDLIGAEMAEKLRAAPKTAIPGTSRIEQSLYDLDLRTGGEGMRGFYDRILPATADRIGKKFGARVQRFGGSVSPLGYAVQHWNNSDPAQRGWTVVSTRSQEGVGRFFDTREAATAYMQEHYATQDPVHVLPISPAMKLAATVDGFPLFQLRASPEGRAQIDAARRAVLSEIKQRIVGDHVGLAFGGLRDTRGEESFKASLGGRDASHAEIMAQYHSTRMISLGLTADIEMLHHEAFHAFQHLGGFTSAEVALLERERERNRALVAADHGLTLDEASYSDEEVDAYAAGIYARTVDENAPGKAVGLHIGLRRAFERVRQFVRRLVNLLNGYGFRISDDIFEAARSGGLRQRLDRGPTYAGGTGVGYGPIWSYEVARAAAIDTLRLLNEPLTQNAVRRPGTFAKASIDKVKQLNQQAGLPPSATVQRPASFPTPVETFLDKVRAHQQDSFRYLDKLQREIEAQRGSPLPEPSDAYLAQIVYPGKRDSRLEDFKADHVDPLVKDMHEAGVTPDEVGLYLIAKHAAERNALMAQRDPNRFGRDGGSGMADATATDIVNEFATAGKEPALERIAQRVYAMIQMDADNRHAAGLISDDTYDHWMNLFPSRRYVPLRGMAERDEEHGIGRYGQGFDIRGREAQQATGRTTLSDNPLHAVIQMAEEGIIRSEKNIAGKSLLRLVKSYPNDDVWTSLRAPMRKYLDEATGLVREVPDTLALQKPNVLAVKVGGHPHYIRLENEGLALAYKNQGMPAFNAFTQKVGKLTRLYSQLQTGKNPEFFIPNFTRDVQEAATTLMALHPKLVPAFLKNLPGALKASGLKEAGRSAGAWDRIYSEWRADGGEISVYGFRDLDQIAAEIERELQRAAWGKGRRIPYETAKKIVGAIDGLNSTFENATRLAVYKAARESGMGNKRAAALAREATVNFSKRGSASPWMNAYFAFYNASVQGSAKNLQLLVRSKRMQAAWVGMTALGFGLALLTRFMFPGDPDDPDGKTPWDMVPDWEKRGNMILPYGTETDTLGNTKLKYVKIPLAFGFKIPFYLGENAADVLMGGLSPGKAAWNVFTNSLDAFNPLGEGQLLTMVFPTLTKPVAELFANQDWRGRNIYPTSEKWNAGMPRSSQPTNSATPPWARTTAELVNRATGGDKYHPGWIDIYPGAIDYSAGWMTGGLGRFLANSWQTGAGVIDGAPAPIERWPIARRFMGETGAQSESQLYYDTRREAEDHRNRFTQAKKGKEQHPDDESAQAAIDSEAEYLNVSPSTRKKTDWKHSSIRALDDTDDKIGELRGQRQAVLSDETLSAKERQSKAQDLEAEIWALQRDGRSLFRAKSGTSKTPEPAPAPAARTSAADPGIQHDGIWGAITDTLFGSGGPKMLKTEDQGYPTAEDAAFARKAGFGYGGDQAFASGDRAKIFGETTLVPQQAAKGKKPSVLEQFRATGAADGESLTSVTAAAGDPARSRVRDITDPKMRDDLTRAHLAINRSALATLGYDPRHVAVDTLSRDTNIAGAYSPKNDGIFVVGDTMDSLVHESIHRGIEKVRQQQPDLFKGWGVDEESVVRQIMRTTMGNIEAGHGDLGDKQIGESKWYFDGSTNASGNLKRLQAIEDAAAEMIRRNRPRGGPR